MAKPKDYGNGVWTIYSWVNQAWLIMWHSEVLGVENDKEIADERAMELAGGTL